jgi:uncharacterized phage protein gp47/JayE
MPFARPSLSDLRKQAAQDIASALPGTDPLLRFSNLNILGAVLAGLAHLHYGYVDWIAQQAVPFTASGEFLESWGAMKGVYRNQATRASGQVTFPATNGTVVPSGTQLVRGDGKTFTTTASATAASSVVIVAATADADPAGLLGAFGNTDAGSVMSLGQAIAGVQSSGTVTTAFTGGADLESDASLRTRVLLAYQNPPHGGDADDYVNWALAVPGVTRAWCVPHGYGAGTVQMFVMLDDAQAAHGGFPQGTNGVATGETRDTVATGDQLTVANYIFPLQPVTALVYVLAPTPNTVNFTIAGISGASTDTKNAIAAAITGVFRQYGSIGSGSTTVQLSYIEAAIAAIPGTAGFVITSPTGNVVSGGGQLPKLGTITYT